MYHKIIIVCTLLGVSITPLSTSPQSNSLATQNIVAHVRQHGESPVAGKKYVLDYKLKLSSAQNDYCLITLYEWDKNKLDDVLRPILEISCPARNLIIEDYGLNGNVSFGTTVTCQKQWRTWNLKERHSDICAFRYSKWRPLLHHNQPLWQNIYNDFTKGLTQLLK